MACLQRGRIGLEQEETEMEKLQLVRGRIEREFRREMIVLLGISLCNSNIRDL